VGQTAAMGAIEGRDGMADDKDRSNIVKTFEDFVFSTKINLRK
jgi:hypothetical protein